MRHNPSYGKLPIASFIILHETHSVALNKNLHEISMSLILGHDFRHSGETGNGEGIS